MCGRRKALELGSLNPALCLRFVTPSPASNARRVLLTTRSLPALRRPQKSSGELTSRLTSDVNLLSVSLTTNLNLIGQNTVNLLGSLAMMFSCSPPLAAVFALASVVFFYGSKKFGEVRQRAVKRAGGEGRCSAMRKGAMSQAAGLLYAAGVDPHTSSVRAGGHFSTIFAHPRSPLLPLSRIPYPVILLHHQLGRSMQKEVQSAVADTNGVATQAISLSRLVRTFAAEDHETHIYGLAVNKLVVQQARTKLLWTIYMPFVTTFNAILLIGVFVYGARGHGHSCFKGGGCSCLLRSRMCSVCRHLAQVIILGATSPRILSRRCPGAALLRRAPALRSPD